MSIYKGTQLIATNGAPGAPGKDGINYGPMIVRNFTELHNNINDNGEIEIKNNSLGSDWCLVGGYGCGVQGGQGSIVYGYDCLGTGSGTAVFGYDNTGNRLSLGTLIEGYGNIVDITNHGTHVEGYQNNFSGINAQGIHIEGAEHTAIAVNSYGGHQGGCGITNNTPMLKLPQQKSGYQSTILEAIGLPNRNPNGEFARIVRADGSMAINGDMSFIALTRDAHLETDAKHPDGVYTLGEIVKALHDANITIPNLT